MKHKKKIAIFAGMLVLFFGIKQLQQNMKADPNQSKQGITAKDLADMDLTPYSVDSGNSGRLGHKKQAYKSKPWKTAANSNFEKGSHDFGHKDGNDKVKKKTADKKKKKKKKDEEKEPTEKTVEIEDIERPYYDTDDDETSGSNSDDVAAGGEGNAPLAPLVAKEEKAIPTTFEEWEAILLPKPDTRATTEFVDYHLVNLVSDDIFFAILRKMIEDPRTEMKRLAIEALGRAPSAGSFAVLVEVIQDQPSGTKTRNLAEIKVRKYDSLDRLKDLEKVLRDEIDSAIAIKWATDMIQQIADNSLRPLENETTPEEGEVGSQEENPATTAGPHPNQRYFQQILERLELILQTTTDPTITGLASSTREHIQNLINNNA